MHVQNSKKKTSWKKFLHIMLLIFVSTVALDVFTLGYYNYAWNKFCEEQTEAQKAGYENSYYICNREKSITLNGVDYIHFHAHHSAFLDGDYEEDLLMPSNLSYLDKASAQNDGLVLFANEVSAYNGKNGEYYTIVNIYSVCDYALTKSNRLIAIVVSSTLIAGFVEIVMALIFAIHKIRSYIMKCKNADL